MPAAHKPRPLGQRVGQVKSAVTFAAPFTGYSLCVVHARDLGGYDGAGGIMGQAQAESVREQLTVRIGQLDAFIRSKRPNDLAREIDAIRTIAHLNGMRPAVAVAQALEMALARGERGPLIHGWVAILRDAVTSDRHDDAACDTYRAACSVRLFG